MPPKVSKKTEDKKKQKVVEDKTFGLKNKNKSKTVQKFIAGVKSQVDGKKSGPPRDMLDKKDKEKEKEKLKLENDIFKPVILQPKAPIGVDPKSIVCEFFKKGMCNKGDKCKYSHNLEQTRKAEKIDIYTDRRNASDQDKELDTMDNWDQAKLESVINSKTTTEHKSHTTSIVCKYFLEAIENKKYGWFWECPNGGDKCMYIHCLPPGYVLKTTKKEEEEVEEIPIEEQIEEERARLATRTQLTLDLFLKWKAEKKKEKEDSDKAAREKREQDIKSGKTMRSGREMFEFNPDLFKDEEDVLDTEELEPEPEQDEGPIITIDVTGTSITTTITNNDPEHKVENTDLFKEEDIPDDDDEAEENGKEEEEEDDEDTNGQED